MTRTATVMTWTAVILLTAVYVFPLWVIDLEAPQYPQGLGLHIWVNKITGEPINPEEILIKIKEYV